MCEERWEIFGQPVPPYFTLLMLGFLSATYFAVRWSKRAGYGHDTMIDLGLIALISGIIGSRILHVLVDGYFWDYVHLCTDPSQVVWHKPYAWCVEVEGVWDATEEVCRPAGRDCFAWAAFWAGGLTYYGGLALAVPVCIWFLRRDKFPVLKGCDVAGMVIPLGLFFGRLGCFIGGCCYGIPTDGPLGVSYPAWSSASEGQFRAGLIAGEDLPSLPVHPTQLYEALGCLAITAALMLLVQPRKRFDGQVLLLFLASYAALRFGLELLRADDRGVFAGLSTSQWIGVGAIAAVAAAWKPVQRLATARPAPAAPPAPPRSESDRRSSAPDGSDPPDPR